MLALPPLAAVLPTWSIRLPVKATRTLEAQGLANTAHEPAMARGAGDDRTGRRRARRG